jgi:hypothetical protein
MLEVAMRKKENRTEWCDLELVISHDNATFFTAIPELPFNTGENYQVMQQPPTSPDCHKVVEHPINSIKSMFRHAFTQLVGRVSQREAMELLVECMEEAVNAESIRADCDTLPATLMSILENEGGWADREFR